MKLSELGFIRFCCDDLIATKLAKELKRLDGSSMELGEWMGFPFEPDYKERESRYLACEIEVLSEITGNFEIGEDDPQENIVVDTTGSVIYAGEEILERLRQQTTVVHLATSVKIKERMLRVYVSRPRPILWRDLYRKELGETNEEALARCYPRLLSARERLYEQYADVTLSYNKRNQDGFGVGDFLGAIEAASKSQ